MVSEDILSLVSEDIQGRRDEYMELMRAHGKMSPNAVIASVRETQEEFLRVISAVPEAQAVRKPGDDDWCLRELALHAAFTERLIAKLIHHLARSSFPSADDLRGAGIGMMPEDGGESFAEIVARIREMNAELLRAVEGLPADADREFRAPHPFFGPLNCLEWAGFQRVHDTDHIQHAQRIIAATGG
jgi:hypothetical protein